jgi:hypothetical protein
MKKLLPKKLRRSEPSPTVASRITNETVAEHREQILAGGRKFKYPIQYARHKLVINALIVAFTSAVLLVLLGWWQLYIAQNSSTFMYRMTRIVPVPVATIDGELVPFDDYLARYRFNEFWLNKYGEVKLDSKDGKSQLSYIKREVLDLAIEDAYAKKLAPQYNVAVSIDEVDRLIAMQRNTANGVISEETYYAALQMTNGWSEDDLKTSLRRTILRNKVSFAYDTQANEQVKQAEPLINATESDFTKVAEQLSALKGGKIITGQTGPLGMAGSFGGLSLSEVSKLEKGAVAGPLMATTDDGYYFVKIIDKTDTQINLTYLKVPLTMFSAKINELRKAGKIHEYIRVAE